MRPCAKRASKSELVSSGLYWGPPWSCPVCTGKRPGLVRFVPGITLVPTYECCRRAQPPAADLGLGLGEIPQPASACVKPRSDIVYGKFLLSTRSIGIRGDRGQSHTQPKFSDEQLGSAVGTIDYVRGTGN